MPIDLRKFTQLYDHLYKIDFTGSLPGMRPPLSTTANIRAATAKGAPFLPRIYRQNFYQPLNDQLPDLMSKLQQQVKSGEKTKAEMTTRLEQFYAATYQHGTGVARPNVRSPLTRFLAVVSNLYRSFVNANKRSSIGVKLVTDTPPLAFFQSDSFQGPYTIESDLMQQFLGVSIGIVSLPATYRDHPVVWASLTHEVCGHDVVHADADLIPELVAAVRSMFTQHFAPRKDPNPATLNALVWSYWIDEAVADVYGVLNMGPIFPINLAGFLGAYRARIKVDIHHEPRPTMPVLTTAALQRDPENGDHNMDDHPIDFLRMYLAIGAIDGLTKLNAAKRADYIASVEAIAHACVGGATEIKFEGRVQISHDDWITINAAMPLADAAAAARRVGNMIATKQFTALNNHSIQDLETWDDADEATAQDISGQVVKKQSIVGLGDDAQLLAGVTLALLDRPDLYDAASSLLNDALDDSYKSDPIWGEIEPDRAFAPSAYRPKPGARGAAKSSGKPAARRSKRR